jgi:hypothetical protein
MPVFTPTFEWGRSGQAGSHRPHVISSVSQLNPKCQRRFGKAEHVESGGAHLGFSALLMRWSRCDWPPPGPLGLVTTTWMFCPHLLRITASCRPQVGKGAGAEDIGFPKWTVGEATKLPGSSVAPLTPRVAPEPPRSMQASTVVCSHSSPASVLGPKASTIHRLHPPSAQITQAITHTGLASLSFPNTTHSPPPGSCPAIHVAFSRSQSSVLPMALP